MQYKFGKRFTFREMHLFFPAVLFVVTRQVKTFAIFRGLITPEIASIQRFSAFWLSLKKCYHIATGLSQQTQTTQWTNHNSTLKRLTGAKRGKTGVSQVTTIAFRSALIS